MCWASILILVCNMMEFDSLSDATAASLQRWKSVSTRSNSTSKSLFWHELLSGLYSPLERSFKESSLWLYSCLVKCFPSLSSSSISCLMRWKNKNVWFSSCFILVFENFWSCPKMYFIEENPDLFDVSVHVWITHAYIIYNVLHLEFWVFE